MTNFKKQAQCLESLGYPIVPINEGKKAPLIKGWQDKTFTASQVTAGVGVKCGLAGSRIVGFDIDVKDKDLARRMSDYVQDELGYTVERVGNAPKTLLVYRASVAGWRKLVSRKFWSADKTDKYQIEVLGEGQQFVAYAVHPDTKQPYEWVDFFGGLEVMPLDDLPVVTLEQVTHVLAILEQMMTDAGLEPVSGSVGIPTTTKALVKVENDDFMADLPVDKSPEEIKELLSYVPADDYDRWVDVGMALHHQFGGDIEGLTMWDDWSLSSPHYTDFGALEKRWIGFNENKSNPVTARTIIKWGSEAKAKTEIELKKAVIAEFLEAIEASEDVHELVDKTAKKIARQIDKDDVVTKDQVRNAILEKYKVLTKHGKGLTKNDVNEILGIARDTSADNLERQTALTEFGNVDRMVVRHGDKIMYVNDTETWYLWEDSFWRKAAQTEIEGLAKETITSMLHDSKALGLIGSDLFDFIKDSMRNVMVKSMVSLLKTENPVPVNIDKLDANKNLFGVANGAIDLTTGKLLPPDTNDRITIITNLEYNPKATCVVWEETLLDVFCQDGEMVAFFQRLIGYTMLGCPDEDLIVIPFGSGSNGKSTILGAIREVFGSHAKTASSETFMGKAGMNSGGSPREDILRLRGSRYVYVTEPDESSELKEGLIKAMTGGEPMPARAAYARATVEVFPTWTVFLPTNHKPIIKGDDHGIWRRVLPIHFARNFDKDPNVKKDLKRAEKLQAEHQGILAWCVQGALAYQEQGLALPAKVIADREEYKSDMDLLAEWLEEKCEVGKGKVATSADLWASWQSFASARGELKYINTAKALSRRLQSRGFKSIRNCMGLKGRGFEGITVKDIVEFENEENK